MADPKQIQGFFIDFSDREIEDVKKALEMLGYTPNGQGMKEMLLDALFGDEDGEESDMERFIRKSRAYIKTHPETVNMGIGALKTLASMFGKIRR